jgi:ABC-type transport system involved in cytochrome c biogenesis permease subunit
MSRTSITSNLSPAFGEPDPSGERAVVTKPRMQSIVLQAIKSLASLKLTVTLFALSIALVFFGTLAQVDEGVWTVVSNYFRWFYVWVPLQIFIAPFHTSTQLPGGFPFPGGLTLGTLLMINLVAAHLTRFQISWKRSGILVLHAGIAVMMVGELITACFAVEANMTIENGATVNYVEERGKTELAVIRHLDAKTDDIVVIPGKRLRKLRPGDALHHDDLPFDVELVKYMVNSTEPDPVQKGAPNLADAGDGKKWRVEEKREGTGVDAEQRIDMASAYVKLTEKGTGKPLGTYLVSLWFSAMTDQPQQVEVNGQTYDVYLRFKRAYKPYAITLEKFTHEVYVGTKTPKNFASTVHLVDRSQETDLETTISMNNPLRHNGETFYQSSFLPGDQGTVLQVVRNPAWRMPYVSCVMVGLGMLVHFCITLWGFLRKQMLHHVNTFSTARDFSMPSLLVPAGTVGVALLYLLVCMSPPSDPAGGMRLHDFGKLPVTAGGRAKPLQSDAMNDLLMISSRRYAKTGRYREAGEYRDAVQWYLDVMTSRMNKNSPAEDYEVFRVDNEQVESLLALPHKPEFQRYSVKEIAPNVDAIRKESGRAAKVDHDKRTLFDKKILELAQRLEIYSELAQLDSPNLLPPRDGNDWRPLADGIRNFQENGDTDEDTVSWMRMFHAYVHDKPDEFNKALDEYHDRLASSMPKEVRKAEFEAFFNDFAPFYQCTVLYFIVLILGCFSWVAFRTPVGRSAFWLCVLTLLVHTWAIGARMYIQDRPPITNLYSTAIYIGWASVVLGLIIEVIFRNSFGVVMAGTIGLLTNIIAHNLAFDGDTLQMMQAVLDTNFWLATHVVVINTGYAATFVAGFAGIVFILLALFHYFTQALHRDLFVAISRILYGILCFATLTSFVGTVLGGIWADQSWGRFWGWDPKENGAVMIVIMNALILHARWGGIVQLRGIAVLSLLGNILTGWSWFGVNMLNVGLHSYGFMEGAAWWLVFFWVSQVALIVLGLMPFLDCWRTAGAKKPEPPPLHPTPRRKRR